MTQQLGRQVDQRRSANSYGGHAADDVDSQLSVKDNFFDGPGAASHPVHNPRALERGPRRRRGRPQLAIRPEDDFAVGADVDQERGAGRFQHAGRKDAGHGVASHKPADHRQNDRPAARVNIEA